VQNILLIKNNHNIDPKIQKLLAKDYTIYIVENVGDALKTVKEKYIDVFIILTTDFIQEGNLDFVQQVYEKQSNVTPFIFSAAALTEDLDVARFKYGWDFIPYPIEIEYFLPMLKKAMIIARTLNEQVIVLKKNAVQYRFNVSEIVRVNRIRNRYIRVYWRNPENNEIETEDFFFEFPLGQFITRLEVGKHLVQSHQSWIVNLAEVKIVDPIKMVLIMIDGTIVPTSQKFVRNFLGEKKRKGGR